MNVNDMYIAVQRPTNQAKALKTVWSILSKVTRNPVKERKRKDAGGRATLQLELPRQGKACRSLGKEKRESDLAYVSITPNVPA